MNRKAKPTVKDVAKQAGVSPSTVSRVISNNPRISQATRDRVFKEMEALQYHPNAIARSLARSRTRIVGVIMPTRESDTLLNPFFPEALRGIVVAASRFGYDVLLSTNSKNKEELDVIKNFIGTGKVDGLILMSSRENDPNIKHLIKTDFPFSVIGSNSGFFINHVENDNVRADYEFTKHILDTGKRSIYFASGPLELSVSKDSLAGYRQALTEAGIPLEDGHIFSGAFDEETGMRIAQEIFQGRGKPDAVVATDDVIAFGLSRAMTNFGYKIPEDIAIGSFNNSVLSRYSDAQLTTIDIHSFDLGQQCVEQLMDAIEEGLRDGNAIIDHELIKRKSTLG